MTCWKTTVQRLLIQQSDQIQLLIIIPIVTLAFLSLIVRTADSAVEPGLEKKRVTQELKRRLTEVQNEVARETLASDFSPLPLLLHEDLGPTLASELSASMVLPRLTCEQSGASNVDPWRDHSSPTVVWGVVGSWREHMLVRSFKGRTAVNDLIAGSAPGVMLASRLSSSQLQKKNPFLARFSCSQTGMTKQQQAEDEETGSHKAGMRFQTTIPKEIVDQLTRRIVSLTVAFEQGSGSPDEFFGTVSGDFDGQTLSFGVLQWNLGSCSLQPLLQAYRRKDNDRFRALMEDGADFMEELLTASCDEAPTLARREMLDEEGKVQEPWISRFRALGREPVFQEVQIAHLLPHVQKAYALADKFGFHSERAVALFFDILIQNGSIPQSVRAQYEQDKREAEHSLGRPLDEVERMALLAHRQAEAAEPKWVKIVRARKLTIACGAGSVNGISYNLDTLGIKLRPYRKEKSVALNKVSNPPNRLARRARSS